jgi:hypothetical protein
VCPKRVEAFAADLANVRQILVVRRILVDPVSHSSPNKQSAHDFTKLMWQLYMQTTVASTRTWLELISYQTLVTRGRSVVDDSGADAVFK